jgi:hypothetical protein
MITGPFGDSLPVGVGWGVTTQRQTTMNDGNTFVPAVIVGFQTAGGNYGNVTIAASDYPDANKVASLLQAAAYTMDQIGSMNDTNVSTVAANLSAAG